MNISAPFIKRPIATTLLTIALALVGVVAFRLLPVAALPQVEFPTIMVSGSLPGASPETMATSVAAPLERQFGRIAGVTEMTSTSTLGSTSIVLQFDLSRNIDGAARDVQGAINAARSYIPLDLTSNPSYRKVNPPDAPILILSLTSDTVGRGRMYDAASTILQQKLSQVEGVGQVTVGGGSLPAVRVELNPTARNSYGIGLGDVRRVLSTTNVNRPKGQLTNETRTWEIKTNDQLRRAEEYGPLIIAYRDNRAVRLSDVATIEESVEDVRTTGLANGKPAVLVILYRQPGANIIETVDRVRDLLPQLEASIPGSITLSVVMDRTPVIRASLRDVERTLVISVILVILVVFAFLRNVRATIIPSVAVPVSLVLSLTTTPMMCATFLRPEKARVRGLLYRASEWVYERMLSRYESSLSWALRHQRGMLALTLLTIALNVYLFIVVPKGFFPQQDSGRLSGNIQAAQDISFQAMRQKLTEVVEIIKSDPAVDTVIGFSGGGGR